MHDIVLIMAKWATYSTPLIQARQTIVLVDTDSRAAQTFLRCRASKLPVGIAIAEISGSAAPRLSLSVNRKMAEAAKEMKHLKRILVTLVIGAIVPLGSVVSLAQHGSNNNRPPKGEEKVKEKDKQNPPSNNNQSNNNRRKP